MLEKEYLEQTTSSVQSGLQILKKLLIKQKYNNSKNVCIKYFTDEHELVKAQPFNFLGAANFHVLTVIWKQNQ